MASATSGYRDLLVWQKAMGLVEQIYEVTTRFPESERYGLTNQLRRAAVSIPSNIAEGHGRSGKDYGRFLTISRGSLAELETQLELSVRLNFISRDDIRQTWQLSQEVGRMLTGLHKSLQQD